MTCNTRDNRRYNTYGYDPGERGYAETYVIWEGELYETRYFSLFDFQGHPLDGDSRGYWDWLEDIKEEARDAEADVQIYELHHPHSFRPEDEDEDDEGCTCMMYARGMEPIWDSTDPYPDG